MSKLRVEKIVNGTVIDHIPAGKGLTCVKLLNIKPETMLALLTNVSSKTKGKKDILKIAGKALTEEEFNKITVIAPTATVNIIKDSNVEKKQKVKLPEKIKGIILCSNPRCSSNKEFYIEPEFRLKTEEPLVLSCVYCEHELKEKEIEKLIKK